MRRKIYYYTAIAAIVLMFLDPAALQGSAKKHKFWPKASQIEMLNWEEAQKIIPRNAIFTVIDVETKKSFRVQRRAGNRHADVQPLTREDTKIMKKIYGGKWSWKRRAVFILADHHFITASMHGMPHGAGAIENDFPGHFCIHFLGSTTHRTRKVDQSHYLMILKAAGKADEYLDSLTSTELTNAFMILVKNQDEALLKKISLTDGNTRTAFRTLEAIDAIHWTIRTAQSPAPFSMYESVPIQVKIYVKDRGLIKSDLSLVLLRTSPLSPWKINMDPLLSVLEEKKVR